MVIIKEQRGNVTKRKNIQQKQKGGRGKQSNTRKEGYKNNINKKYAQEKKYDEE